MPIGKAERLHFALLPTSWSFKAAVGCGLQSPAAMPIIAPRCRMAGRRC